MLNLGLMYYSESVRINIINKDKAMVPYFIYYPIAWFSVYYYNFI